MSKRIRRLILCLLLVGASGAVAGTNASCARYAGDSALGATDFCFMFDCDNGVLGGLIDPCAAGTEVFWDCPP